MREIKFRYIFEDIEENGLILVTQFWNLSDIEINDIVYDNEILIARSQYTGLKDKNGVEIYEGDIVECDFKYRSYLSTFIEEVSILNTNLTLPFAREWIIENKEYKDIVGSCKVIGNIYENSELLRED